MSYLGHKAVALRCAGRVGEAIEVLRESLEVRLDASNHQRIHARNRCDLADCLRIVGRTGEAGEHVDHAGRIFARHQFDGEHADHYLLVLAKIEGGRAALAHLAAARRVLWTRGHTNGLVRAELLRARLDPSPATARRARAAVLRTMARVPDLRTCPRLRGILRRWERWVGGEGGKPADPFWYL